MFVEECEYPVKEKKMTEYTTNDIEISSDCDREDSDEENCNETKFWWRKFWWRKLSIECV